MSKVLRCCPCVALGAVLPCGLASIPHESLLMIKLSRNHAKLKFFVLITRAVYLEDQTLTLVPTYVWHLLKHDALVQVWVLTPSWQLWCGPIFFGTKLIKS